MHKLEYEMSQYELRENKFFSMFGFLEGRVSKCEIILGMVLDKLESLQAKKKAKGSKRSGNASIKSKIIKKAAEKSMTIS